VLARGFDVSQVREKRSRRVVSKLVHNTVRCLLECHGCSCWTP
jgi:hypothetical protein